MPTAHKASVIQETQERYQRAAGVIFTDFRGLKVKHLQELRKTLREKGGDFHVVKNTLFRLAAGEDASQFPEEMTAGPTATVFIYENETDCAKALFDFGRTHKNLVVKGGFIAGKTFGPAQMESLSKLPPRDVLLAQVVSAAIAPLTSLVGVIEALYADPIRVIGAVADKVAEGSGAESASPSSPDTATIQE